MKSFSKIFIYFSLIIRILACLLLSYNIFMLDNNKIQFVTSLPKILNEKTSVGLQESLKINLNNFIGIVNNIVDYINLAPRFIFLFGLIIILCSIYFTFEFLVNNENSFSNRLFITLSMPISISTMIYYYKLLSIKSNLIYNDVIFNFFGMFKIILKRSLIEKYNILNIIVPKVTTVSEVAETASNFI